MAHSFPLGSVYATAQAVDELHPEDIQNALSRHAKGDWGDVCKEDWQENELSVNKHLQLLSVYRDRKGTKFWIITEADRSSTMVLMPEDY